MTKHSPAVIPNELIEQKIYWIRGHKFMLDADLAALYGVTTGKLNLADRRNLKRFPADFMFQLGREETQSLLLQDARAKGRGGRRTPPYAFTEQGVSMLSSVLNSERAIEVNIAIMRAFVRLRAMLATHADLARRLRIGAKIRRTISRRVRGDPRVDDTRARSSLPAYRFCQETER